MVAVVQEAHERRDAERAGHQHHFVVRIGRQLSNLIEDGGRLPELGLGETYFAHEAVQVLDQRNQYLSQARFTGPFHDGENGWGNVFLS